MDGVPWSKRAVRSSEKLRLLLTSVKYSTDSRPVTKDVSAPPALPAPVAAAAATTPGAKQRGQQQHQQQSSPGKTVPVFLDRYLL